MAPDTTETRWSGDPNRPQDYRRETMACVNALLAAVRELPKLDEDGHSECPFAETLYAQMEEKMSDLQRRKGVLHQRLAETEGEIRRCEHSRDVVAMHKQALHGGKAREQYAHADNELVRRYRLYLRERDETLQVLRAVDSALATAYARQYPGRKPHRSMSLPAAQPDSGARPLSPPIGDLDPKRGRRDQPISGNQRGPARPPVSAPFPKFKEGISHGQSPRLGPRPAPGHGGPSAGPLGGRPGGK